MTQPYRITIAVAIDRECSSDRNAADHADQLRSQVGAAVRAAVGGTNITTDISCVQPAERRRSPRGRRSGD